MSSFFHSVTLDEDACKGCINCIKRCPTNAIRVRNDKAYIIKQRCVDCGECIRVCPHHAKKAITDPISIIKNYKYPIALMPPSFIGQFNNLEDTSPVLGAFKQIGFADVFDVSRAAELISDATRKLLEQEIIPRPVLSSACPAVLRLIRVRFPGLIPHVLPLKAPVELAAQLAKEGAIKSGIPEEDIGCIFISPCPAKVTASKMPLGTEKSAIDANISVKEMYPVLLAKMSAQSTEPPQAGRIGVGWGESGGETAALFSVDEYLAADGVENVIRVLEDLESEKYPNLQFVELNICNGGCVGGVLQVENPYIAKAKLKKLRRYMPVSLNRLEGTNIPESLRWNKSLDYQPVMELGTTAKERFEKYAELESILLTLPGLDCGSCGAPSCASFAEDIVRGHGNINSCVVLMRYRMENVLRALDINPKDGLKEALGKGKPTK